jgi:hypothetical protein
MEAMKTWHGILTGNLWIMLHGLMDFTSNSRIWGGPRAKFFRPLAQKNMIGLKCYCFLA